MGGASIKLLPRGNVNSTNMDGYISGYDIIENTKNRVVLKTSHDLSGDAGINGYFYHYIYPDRFFIDFKHITNGVTIAYSNDYTLFYFEETTSASGTKIAENGGSEGTTVTDSSNYLGTSYTDGDFIIGTVYTDYIQKQFYRSGNAKRPTITFGTETLSAGTYHFCIWGVVDSAARENGSKLYTSTERLEMGEQYKDTALALTTGTAVTGLTDPLSIGSSGFASDGAIHLEMS